jgi:uncharacterized protein GlcG (DUF336 family)
VLDKETAKRIMAAAGAKSEAMGKPVSIAIVDIAGAMVLFERFGNIGSFTAAVAEGKAVGSAYTGRDSGALEQMMQAGGAVFDAIAGALVGRRFVPRQGAVPIVKDGMVIGAIGVSGGTSQEDEDIARAGTAAV